MNHIWHPPDCLNTGNHGGAKFLECNVSPEDLSVDLLDIQPFLELLGDNAAHQWNLKVAL